MDLQLQGKLIVVSGGAKGIGRGISERLAQEGAIPFIIGHHREDNEQFISELKTKGFEAFQAVAELTDPEACAAVIKIILQQTGRIDGLVNNAGVNDGVGLESGDYAGFVQSLHRNLIHYYLLAHHCLPELIRNRGAIVNITSKTAETGQGNTSAYAAANGGRNALTREWAVELLKYNIRVNAIAVAECWTPQYEKWIRTLSDAESSLKKITDRIPLGNRMTTPAEIGSMAAFLLSDLSSHTTGQIIHVDGGYVHLDRALANA